MWNQLAICLQGGNVYAFFILFLGFVGCALILERYFMLQFVYSMNFNKFTMALRKAVRAEEFDAAMHICKAASHTSLPKIALIALEASAKDPKTVAHTIEEEVIDFLPLLRARLALIPTLATIVLLTGALATLNALLETFNSIASIDMVEKQTNLSQGVTGALNPMIIGIIFGMIFLVGYQILESMSVKISEKIHLGATVITNLLVPQDTAYVTTQRLHHHAASRAGASADKSVESKEIDATLAPSLKQEEFDESSLDRPKGEEEIF